MAQRSEWLSEVFREVREEVEKWPEWKRSDEVRRELRRLDESKREAPRETPAPATMKKEEGGLTRASPRRNSG